MIFLWFGILKPLGNSPIALLALQMVGTLMPLVILPHVTFQEGMVPYGPTMEGQYIIKNLLILSAALVVGGGVRRRG